MFGILLVFLSLLFLFQPKPPNPQISPPPETHPYTLLYNKECPSAPLSQGRLGESVRTPSSMMKMSSEPGLAIRRSWRSISQLGGLQGYAWDTG